MSRETEAMGCRRAFDVDLVACLLDRNRPEWEAFRDHYPTCAECTTEVRTWTELQAELAPAHPDPAQLVRYEDEPTSLRAEDHHAIRDHVATCMACRDELHMLRTTDLPALVRAGTAVVTPARTAAAATPPVRARRRRLGARLRALVWHPGLAYALVLLLLVPALAPYRDVLVPNRGSLAEKRSDDLRVAARQDAALEDAQPPRGRILGRALPTEAPHALAEQRAAAPVAEAPAAAPVWPRLDLNPTSSHLVIAAAPGIILSLPAPGDAETAGPAELRIHDASGRRELREQYFGPPTQRFTMRVPGEWLEPGRYVVELYAGDETPAVTATLDVAARADR